MGGGPRSGADPHQGGAADSGAGAEVFTFPASFGRAGKYGDCVRFGVLGILTVSETDGTPLRLGGPARRRLLAALLARVGRTVPVDTLIEDLWADAPPATAEKTLQSHVVRLRDDLGRGDGGSPVVTEMVGYRLQVPSSSVDAWCFERDLDAGRRYLANRDSAAACTLLDQALSWWRGEAYAEFPDAAFAVSERLRLAELRALAVEARTDAALELGGAGELVAELETRVLHEPYREHSWEQLVTALYRAGRQGDALAAYRRARERLVDDLGLEPSAALRTLETRVLDQDPTLLVRPRDAGVIALPTRPRTGGSAAAVPAVLEDPRPNDLGVTGEADLTLAQRVVAECPYRGLSPYGEDDASVFIGRERLTAELAGRLVDNDLMVVTGPSGAGKSSLVRAGLVPALRSGAITGSAAWRVRVTTPGSDPLSSLDGIHADLVIVDQAEELFTLTSEDVRSTVGRRLAALLSAGTRVILVLRADFYGRLAELAAFTGRIGAATALIGPMTEEEIRRVVVEPAALVGVSTAPGLAEQVVADVRGQAGSLPLLSAALERTWQNRTGDRLTLEAYHSGGGVRGSLESMAEDAYLQLDADAQAAARRLLLRMATRSAGVWVRRPAPLASIVPVGDEPAALALSVLAEARIVTVSASSVELAHESLLGGWPRLRSWLDERAMVSEQLEHLAASTTTWELSGCADEDLLRGARLQAGLDWRDRHPDDLTGPEDRYLEASKAAVGAQLATERRRRRGLTVAVAAVAVAAVAASLVGGIAVRERSQADASALSADARRLAALSYTASDQTTALLLAAASYRLQDSADARGALLAAEQRAGGAIFRIPTENRLLWVGTPSDGSRVLAMDNSRTVLVFDPTKRRLVNKYRIPGDAVGDISPDGSNLVVCGPSLGESPGGVGRVIVLDANNGAIRHVLPTLAAEAVVGGCGRFTGDGRHLVLPALIPGANGKNTDGATSTADALAVYDTGRWSAAAAVLPEPSQVAAIATSSDRIAVQRADRSLQVFDASSLRLVATGRPPGTGKCDDTTIWCVVAINRAGSRVALINPLQPQTPEQLPVSDLSGPVTSGQGLSASITHLAFSPDGTQLAAAASDGSVLVVTAPGAATLVSDPGTTASVQGLAWAGTGAGAALYTGGLDSQLVSWNLAAIPRTIELGMAVPPDDGNQALFGNLIVGTRPGPAGGEQLYTTDVRTGHQTAWPITLPADDTPQWLVASPDGSRAVLSLSQPDGSPRVLVWDTSTGARLLDRTVTAPHNAALPYVAAMSADGTQVFLAIGLHRIQVIDVASGALLRAFDIGFLGPEAARLSAEPYGTDPRGRLVVLGYDPQPPPLPASTGPAVPEASSQRHQQVALVNTRTGQVDAQAEVGSLPVTAIGWSHDNRRISIGTAEGTLAEYQADTLRPLTARVMAHDGYILATSYSPDGSTIVTSGTDGTVALWDATTLRRLGPSTVLGRSSWVWAWYNPAGTIVGTTPASISDPTPDRWFNMAGTPHGWVTQVCRFAGRDLTPAEWSRYVGDRPYQHVCAQTTS